MRQRLLFAAALVTAVGIAACSGGGTVSSGLPPAGSGGGGTGTSNSVTATLGGTATTAPITTTGGQPGTLAIPAGTGSATFVVSNDPPSGFVGIQSTKRTAARLGDSALFYLTVTAGRSAVTLSALPGATVTLDSAPDNANEAIGTMNGTYTYWQTIATGLTVSGRTVYMPAIAGSYTIAAGGSLTVACYVGGTIAPPVHPIGIGNTYAYAGNYALGITYTYPTSLPSAVPTGVGPTMPPTSVAATVNTDVTVTDTAPFFATSGDPVDFHSVETDAYALQSKITTTDAWMEQLDAAFVLYGTYADDGANDTYATQYAAPLVLDQTPEVDGASWTNGPASTIVEHDADGTNATRIYNADGTYAETQNIPAGRTLIITVNPDGSGTYGGTGFNTFRSNNGLSFSTPSPTGVITIQTVPTPKPTGTPPPPTTIATPGAWYPQPFVAYAETDSFAAARAVDASCHLASSFGTTAGQVTQTVNRVDPVLGYTETETTDSYYQIGIGLVCVVMNDVQVYHYNYNNDDGTLASAAAVFGTGGVKSTQTASETVSLQSTNAVYPTASKRAAATNGSGAQALSPIAVVFSRAQFDARIAVTRRARENAMRAYFDRITHAPEVR